MSSSSHANIVQQAFTAQVSSWAGPVPTQLQEVVSTLNLDASQVVLDVAAGSCRVSRAMAPWVKHVIAVELTAAMLNQGKVTAQREKQTNITFGIGAAEQLAFADNSFDMTITRYSFHHFLDPALALNEMVRVTKPGGRVIVIDILSPDDDGLAESYNFYEWLRDPSHTRSPQLNQLRAWYETNKLSIVTCHLEEGSQALEDWLNLPALAEPAKEQIRAAVQQELAGGPLTGLQAFLEADQVKFRVNIVRFVGQKQ